MPVQPRPELGSTVTKISTHKTEGSILLREAASSAVTGTGNISPSICVPRFERPRAYYYEA